MAYAGHQFGNFVPQLGDGRAILLSEVVDRNGERRDVQLKGAGRTPFSRRGDGRATLGPVLREYLVSEAMHALGIPTTRALAAVSTGEPVFRDRQLAGAVLTRVASSHIRIGTFQYFAARGDVEAVERLSGYAIDRHFPEARDFERPILALLQIVVERQASLVARWMHVGFIHGVMNTDNTALSGETIDFGPCAFIDSYDPATTLETREKQLRVAASALAHQGVERESIRAISHLVTLEHFKLILRFLLDRHDGQTSPQVAQIAAFLKGVARHWAKADDLTLLQMQKVASRLSTGRRGLTAKNRERLRPFDDPQTVALFLGLPQRIRREVEKDPRAPERKAVMAQMAAAIAILLVVPLRIGNLAKIDMRKNLIARGNRVYLVVPEGDTKNGEPVDFELPPEIVEIVGWYVREYRPHLLRAPTNSLFPGEGSRAKSAAGLGAQIKAASFRFTGLTINPHLFRHAGAKIFLDQRPGQYEVVRQVLRHRSIETTTSFYAGAETRSAGQHYASVINKLREDLNQKQPTPRARRGPRSGRRESTGDLA